jgi:hypothetical protein
MSRCFRLRFSLPFRIRFPEFSLRFGVVVLVPDPRDVSTATGEIMINNPPTGSSTQPSGKRPLGRRLALAGVLTAAVLAGGAGVAYATGTAGTGLAESGYATVVDEGPQTRGTADGDRGDCPERGAGGSSSESPSESPSESLRQTAEQAPTPEGDI